MNDMLKKEAVQNMRKNPCSRARENEYWTEEELERLKTMFDDGEDFTDIAFVLQRSEPAVSITTRLCSGRSRTMAEREPLYMARMQRL